MDRLIRTVFKLYTVLIVNFVYALLDCNPFCYFS